MEVEGGEVEGEGRRRKERQKGKVRGGRQRMETKEGGGRIQVLYTCGGGHAIIIHSSKAWKDFICHPCCCIHMCNSYRTSSHYLHIAHSA